jgi:DNA-binding Lrp family transcriptional regulator
MLEEMDDIDRKLDILLCSEPRIHLRELASRLGISRQAVHHRVQAMMKSGVMKRARASISISYLDAVPVCVFGRSGTALVDRTLDRLGENEFTHRVVVAGGNYVYVVGVLREVSELGGYVEFVKRTAEMPEPTVGIYCLDDGLTPRYSVDGSGRRERKFRELSPLDLKIIAQLRDDARKPVTNVARALKVSPKTVRRHLDAMILDGSMEISVPADLALAGDFLSVMNITLKDGANKLDMGRRLLSACNFQDTYVRTYLNLPNHLAWVFWSNDMAEVRKAARMVAEDTAVEAVMLNFVYQERLYKTWKDRLGENQTHAPKRAGRAKNARG